MLIIMRTSKFFFFPPESVMNYPVYACVLYLDALRVCASSQASASSHMFQLFESLMQKTIYFAFHELENSFCHTASVKQLLWKGPQHLKLCPPDMVTFIQIKKQIRLSLSVIHHSQLLKKPEHQISSTPIPNKGVSAKFHRLSLNNQKNL